MGTSTQAEQRSTRRLHLLGSRGGRSPSGSRDRERAARASGRTRRARPTTARTWRRANESHPPRERVHGSGMGVRAEVRRLSPDRRTRGRRGSARQPERQRSHAHVPRGRASRARASYEGPVLDGEVVVHDEQGLPSFGRLQKRGRLQNRRDIARAALELPATFYAFDLLALAGADLRELPLLERKALLREVLPTSAPSATPITSWERARRSGPRWASWASRASWPSGRRPVPRRTLALLVQDPGSRDRGLRRGGLHRSRERAPRFRSPPPG